MNLPERIVVDVTNEHIEEGHPRDPRLCPVARALFEHLGDEVSVAVRKRDDVEICHRRDVELRRYVLDAEGRRFVRDFDFGHGVGPTTVVARRKEDSA